MNKRFAVLILILAVCLVAVPVNAGGLPQAVGAGHLTLPDGTLRTFSFAANKLADGRVVGQANVVIHEDQIARGIVSIDCLRIVDFTYFGYRVAVMSGWIDQVNEPFHYDFENNYAIFSVWEKLDGTNDLVGDGIVIPHNEYDCNSVTFTGDIWEAEHGSISIRP